jgi:putative addiction module antidote
MNKPLKIVAVGNSTGVILPKDLLASLRLDRGDELFPVKTPNGVELRVYDPEFEAQMDAARSVMKCRKNVLRELAK